VFREHTIDMGFMVESMIFGYYRPKIRMRFYFKIEKLIVVIESDSA
jgi:hypothetical protein